ncbi:hypothetical protein JW319_22190 [Enterobacter cloacae subsp. cloacae]|jgi:hypothetical protein|uniref:Uncharacterized protein n=1 Tax=Enterobacter cloacae TaxID=550 RepID=A0A3R9AQM4_ENTCL|nr:MULTISPECIES: hypothetical protein [Enterobacter]AFM58334.1 hypothetical protein A3UG_02935 [Enterobacter cloacae subsp. dissolvens SDM]ELE9012166.1 hypothetical protein [Enterobacter cloacae]KKY78040.1 hypothetical protein OA44_20000 [Enterobacter cloacae]MBA7853070.1 hypothetical protein [Enterobacter cloacae]MBW4204071.1 hypothetical protein [Enterobacter cloacae subsp. cloacae]
MAEGLKMFYARDARNIHSHIPVADIKESERDRLICEFCPAKISWVKAHKRNGKNISAFLRLQKNEEHTFDCKNSVKSAITSLVAHSQNIEDGKLLLEAQDSAFIFRMNVLIEASAALRKASFTPDEEADSEEKARKRIRYKKTEKRLADYFNTAAGIAKIRAKIEESSDKKTLSDLVKIDYNGKKISWNDFFYDEDRYPILFKKAEKIAHPVAILITVKQAQKHINTERGSFCSLKGELCTLEHEDKSKEFFAPGLTCNDTTFFENLGAKDEIIVIGKVRPTIKQWGEGKIFKNLNINVFNKKQITRLKD